MHDLLVVIPALKKNAVIPDQLIKKLDGITLIQRAINTAKELTDHTKIFVITDSEEISLICERNHIDFYYNPDLNIDPDHILREIQLFLDLSVKRNILLFRGNTPLVDVKVLQSACEYFADHSDCIVVSVKKEKRKLLKIHNESLDKVEDNNYYEELKAFYIFNSETIQKQDYRLLPFVIENEKSIEIEGYQDWWVCEKVLQRKKIVFHVIGSIESGMGHIYHSLSLAHEITNHEIIFVCHERYRIAVDKIASMDYQVIATNNVLQTILELKPDLVINDVLNTEEPFIKSLKNNNFKVINFEDLGNGSHYADIVFNELYDTPQIQGDNYLWGHEYITLRDEFYEAIPHQFNEKVTAVLITFGGTDQNNLTLVTLQAIIDIAREKGIKIYIVCGSAYLCKTELEIFIQKIEYPLLTLTYASGVISKIMEQTQIAISANGRTVYELADMNIPSIVLSHHEREATHTFAALERGFINLGIYQFETSAKKIAANFLKLVEDTDYRKLLYLNILQYSFRENKKKVVSKILEQL